MDHSYKKKLVSAAAQGYTTTVQKLLANESELRLCGDTIGAVLEQVASNGRSNVVRALMQNQTACNLMTGHGIYLALLGAMLNTTVTEESRNQIVRIILTTQAIHERIKKEVNNILEKIACIGTASMLTDLLEIPYLHDLIDEPGACTALVLLTLFSPDDDRGDVLSVLLNNPHMCTLIGNDNHTATLIFKSIVKYPRTKTIAALFGCLHMRNALGEGLVRAFANSIFHSTKDPAIKILLTPYVGEKNAFK